MKLIKLETEICMHSNHKVFYTKRNHIMKHIYMIKKGRIQSFFVPSKELVRSKGSVL